MYDLVKHRQINPDIILRMTIKECFRWNNLNYSGHVPFACEYINIHGYTIKKGEILRPLHGNIFREKNAYPNEASLYSY